MSTGRDWNWPPSMDAVVAAPESHRVLFENDDVRVLEVTIAAGRREPEHTHREPSVMIVDGPAQIRYYQGAELLFSSPAGSPAVGTQASWMDPEGPHAVENVDTHPYHAIRVELKQPARSRTQANADRADLDACRARRRQRRQWRQRWQRHRRQ